MQKNALLFYNASNDAFIGGFRWKILYSFCFFCETLLQKNEKKSSLLIWPLILSQSLKQHHKIIMKSSVCLPFFLGSKWTKDLRTTWLNSVITGHFTPPRRSPSYAETTSPMLDSTCTSRPQRQSSSCPTCWSSSCAWWEMELCASLCWGVKTCGLSPTCSF